MSCSDCPEGLMVPPELDPDDEKFGKFLREDFVELMTPMIVNLTIEAEVAVPLEVGQAILDSAREFGVEHAIEEARGYTEDISTVKDFIIGEIDASKRVLELDGYDVKIDVRENDTPRIRARD